MIEKNIELKGIAELLIASKKVSIISHKNTDGDALSSMCAISTALLGRGNDSSVFLKSPPNNYSFLNKYVGCETKDVFEPAETILVVDVSSLERTDFPEEIAKARKSGSKIIVIDHHKTGEAENFADYFYKDTEASASAEIIFKLIGEMGVVIEKNLATCLLSGIISDTSNFVNQNTTSKTLEMASELISKGARQNIIIENTFRAESVGQLRFWGRAMERIVFLPEYNTMTTYITMSDIEQCGLESDPASGTVNILNTVKGNPIVFLVAEQDGELKVSMRTRNSKVDLSKLGQMFGGGGHPGAAGFTLAGKILEKDGEIRIV